MLFDDFECKVKILNVLKLSWDHCDSPALPRDFHAFSFRLSGHATYIANDTTLAVHEGNILYVPQNLPYHITGENEVLYVIHFELEEKEQKYLEVFHINDYKKAKRLFASCFDAWSKKAPGYYFRTLSIFYQIVELMSCQQEPLEEGAYKTIQPAMDYIHSHFTETKISITTLCELSHLSDTWFRKLFAQCYNTTPLKYINKLRISHAIELLEMEYKVEHIAQMVGFDDPKYFSTVFKQHTGFSPLHYRNNHLN